MPYSGSNSLAGLSGRKGSLVDALASRLLMQAVVATSLKNRLSILIYHRVRPEADPLFPSELDAARFDEQLTQLGRAFTIISLSEAVEGLRNGTLPRGAACITFDDGYADNVEIALPILLKHGISATFFLATGFLNGGRMWNDKVIEVIRTAPESLDLRSLGYGQLTLDSVSARQGAIDALLESLKYLPLAAREAQVDRLCGMLPDGPPGDLMMTSSQVRALHQAGMEIGAHTVNHPILSNMAPEAARQEIVDCKRELEDITGTPVRWFAYPNGKPQRDYGAEHVGMVKAAGFEAAVSTAWGAASPEADLFQLPRFTPEGAGQLRFTLRMIQNLTRTVNAA